MQVFVVYRYGPPDSQGNEIVGSVNAETLEEVREFASESRGIPQDELYIFPCNPTEFEGLYTVEGYPQVFISI